MDTQRDSAIAFSLSTPSRFKLDNEKVIVESVRASVFCYLADLN